MAGRHEAGESSFALFVLQLITRLADFPVCSNNPYESESEAVSYSPPREELTDSLVFDEYVRLRRKGQR